MRNTIHLYGGDLEEWKRLNPNIEVKQYNISDCLTSIKENLTLIHCNIFELIDSERAKVDFWRICILYSLGGAAVDGSIRPVAIEYNGELRLSKEIMMSPKKNERVKNLLMHYLEKYVNGEEYDESWDLDLSRFEEEDSFVLINESEPVNEEIAFNKIVTHPSLDRKKMETLEIELPPKRALTLDDLSPLSGKRKEYIPSRSIPKVVTRREFENSKRVVPVPLPVEKRVSRHSPPRVDENKSTIPKASEKNPTIPKVTQNKSTIPKAATEKRPAIPNPKITRVSSKITRGDVRERINKIKSNR